MNRTKKILKKVTAAAAASVLVLSGTSTVFAAESYQETEKAALDKLVSGVVSYLDTYMQQYEKAEAGSSASLTLKAEDAGKSMLGMLASTDISWLDTISMDMDVTIQDSMEAMKSDVLVNGAPFCTINIMMDVSTLEEYIQIPELSESWMRIPLTVTASDASGNEISQETTQKYFEIMSNLSNMIPDTEVLGTLLERYGDMVIDNMAEGSSVEEEVSVDGISEACTVYEGQITESSFLTMAEQILTEAREDQDLKVLLDTWTESGVVSEDIYTQFQSAVDGLLEDLSSEEASGDTSMITSRIWVNGDGKIVGREFGIADAGQTTPVFTWKSPSQDENSALLIEFSSGTDSVTLTGSGQSAEGLLTGDYILAVNGVETVDFAVENFETHPENPGYYNGSITVSFPDNGSEETPNPLAVFGAVINIASDAEAETSQIDLSVTSSGAALATLSMTSGLGDGVEAVDASSMGTIVNIDNEEEVLAYIQSMEWSSLIENASAAGIPDEIVTQIDSALQAAVEEASNPAGETDSAEEAPVDEVPEAESAPAEEAATEAAA